MITLSFYLNKQKISKHGLVPIYMLITFNGQRIRKAVKHVKVKPSEWNHKKQEVKKPAPHSPYNGYEEYNAALSNLKEIVHHINRNLLKFGIKPTKEFILNRIENPQLIEINRRSFFHSFEEYIKVGSSHKRENTNKGIITIYNLMQSYEKSIRTRIEFEDITIEFLEKLRTYCFHDKFWSTNYFKKIIQVLKAFMTWSADRGYHQNSDYKRFKAREEEKEIIYLDMEELMALYNYDFHSERLKHVRDVYCFACFSGLRFSDLISLTPSNISEDFIHKKITKTGEVNRTIPLNKYSKAILKKYRGTIWNPLPKISVQKFNSYIKECCKMVGINANVTVYRTSGGVRTETVIPKWEVITSHTARKTFVTNSLILGMSETIVKEITGHKKQEAFRRYVKISDRHRSNEMNKIWN